VTHKKFVAISKKLVESNLVLVNYFRGEKMFATARCLLSIIQFNYVMIGNLAIRKKITIYLL